MISATVGGSLDLKAETDAKNFLPTLFNNRGKTRRSNPSDFMCAQHKRRTESKEIMVLQHPEATVGTPLRDGEVSLPTNYKLRLYTGKSLAQSAISLSR